MSGWIPRAPLERPSRNNNITENDLTVLNESLGEDASDMNPANNNAGNGGGGGGGGNGTNRFGAVRDRLFHVMLVKMALSYHQHVPYFCRRLIEFYFLVTAISLLGLLIYVHYIFNQFPGTCLQEIRDVWPKKGVLRVEVIQNWEEFHRMQSYNYNEGVLLFHECNYNIKEILTNWPHSLPRDLYSSSVAISSEQSDRINNIGSSRIFVSSNYKANFVVITDGNNSNESNNNNDENANNSSLKSSSSKKVAVHKSGGGAPDSPPKRRQLPVMALFELRTYVDIFFFYVDILHQLLMNIYRPFWYLVNSALNVLFGNLDDEHWDSVSTNELSLVLGGEVIETNEGDAESISEDDEEESTEVYPTFVYVVEYSLHYGLLKLTPSMRREFGIPVMLIQLDADSDECFGDWKSRFLMRYLIGFEDIIMSSVRSLAENETEKGYLRDMISGEHYHFVSVGISRASYLTALLVMLIFTFAISMLLRFSHHQIFLFIVDLLQMFELNQPLVFPIAPLLTVILALVGMEAIMSEIFNDTSTAFYVILLVWVADQYDAICCHSPVGKRFWLRFFYLYHFAFYAYQYRFNGQYGGLALLTSAFFILHSMIFFFHHYEIPLIVYQEGLQRTLIGIQNRGDFTNNGVTLNVNVTIARSGNAHSRRSTGSVDVTVATPLNVTDTNASGLSEGGRGSWRISSSVGGNGSGSSGLLDMLTCTLRRFIGRGGGLIPQNDVSERVAEGTDRTHSPIDWVTLSAEPEMDNSELLRAGERTAEALMVRTMDEIFFPDGGMMSG